MEAKEVPVDSLAIHLSAYIIFLYVISVWAHQASSSRVVNLAAVTNIWSITKIFNSPKMNQENVQKEKMEFRGDRAILFIGGLLHESENNILSWKNVPLIFLITSRAIIILDKFISLIGNAWLSNSHIPHTFAPAGSFTSLIFGNSTKSRRWGWSYWQISPLWICQTQESLSIITVLKEFWLLPTPIGWCSTPFFPEINCQLSSIIFLYQDISITLNWSWLLALCSPCSRISFLTIFRTMYIWDW